MATREHIRQLIDDLSDEDLDAVAHFIERLLATVDDPLAHALLRASVLEPETLSSEDHGAIAEAEADVAAGRVFGRPHFRVHDTNEDIWADYDPEKAWAGMRAAAGSWGDDFDAEAFIEYIYQAREDGTRPADRPRYVDPTKLDAALDQMARLRHARNAGEEVAADGDDGDEDDEEE